MKSQVLGKICGEYRCIVFTLPEIMPIKKLQQSGGGTCSEDNVIVAMCLYFQFKLRGVSNEKGIVHHFSCNIAF